MNFVFVLLLLFSQIVSAQSGDTSVEVEALYDDLEEKEDKKEDVQRVQQTKRRVDKKSYDSLADLVELAPFDDVAVIQKRFMPKTGRFEFSASMGNSINNAFFNNWGLVGKFAYYLSEKHGVELMYYWLNSSERDITENLREDQDIETRSLVVPANYLGLSYKWVPVYGKIAWFNRTIVPFDLFFTLGGGLSQTDELEESEPTFHGGMGQMYFIGKSWGVRWDLAMNIYQAKIIQKNNLVFEEATKSQTDLFLAIGVSFYWPEATYR